MECPACGLINPPNSIKCDCGYDFIEQTGRGRPWTLRLDSVLLSLWFAWLLVTTGDFVTFSTAGDNRLSFLLGLLFNLFTPILLGTLLKSSVLGLTIPLLFFGLIVGDLIGWQIKNKILRVVYNLTFLFSMTVAIDMITWGSPVSIHNLGQLFGGHP